MYSPRFQYVNVHEAIAIAKSTRKKVINKNVEREMGGI